MARAARDVRDKDRSCRCREQTTGGSDCCGIAPEADCRVEAVVSIDPRGQMVLPKDVRDRFGIAGATKLAVVSWSQKGEPCCLTLLPADRLAEQVRSSYGPILRDLLESPE
ncbi:MAG: HgcAB-associated protein [Thermoplasmata archaeon]